VDDDFFKIDCGDVVRRNVGVVGVVSGVESKELRAGEGGKGAIVAVGNSTRGFGTFFRILRGGGAGNNDRGSRSFSRDSESLDEVDERGLGTLLMMLAVDLEVWSMGRGLQDPLPLLLLRGLK
jgi:hypothetical protein